MAQNPIYKPSYYDKFHCVGGDCSFTCCQEWKIAVDEETNLRWKKMTPPAGMATRRKNMSIFTTFKDGGRVIVLDRDHKCPFLQKDGLCCIVCCYGEEAISHTCHIFPREIHYFQDRTEYTLMPCCPEVIDLLWAEKSFCVEADRRDWQRRLRQLFLTLLQRVDDTPEVLLLGAFYLMQNVYETENTAFDPSRTEVEELLQAIRERGADLGDELAECNELFLDLIDNYRKENMYPGLLKEAAKLAEQIERAEGTGEDYLEEYGLFRKAWAEYAPLMKKLLAQEIYADLLIWSDDPGQGEEEIGKEEIGKEEIRKEEIEEEEVLDHMMIHLEWTAMEYVMMRHLSFLTFCREKKLTYEMVREHIVLTSRMMGYEDDDIYEYLENSFESMIWEWGYMALIIGA